MDDKYGYPIQSTRLKVIRASNFIGFPLVTTRNVKLYYPKTEETPEGHTNCLCKSAQSKQPKSVPLNTRNTHVICGKK